MKKVLIIDDDKVDQMAMKRWLEGAGGFEIFTALSGEEGINVAQSNKVDIVIVDTILPGMTGPDTCRKLKEPGFGNLKVIVTTGSIDAVDAYNARKAGADDYVVKTMDSTPFLDAIKRMA